MKPPESAVSRVLSGREPVVIISLGRSFPGASCDLPGSPGETGRLILPYLVLLRVGFA
jgi:hypothetical protein